MFDLRVRLQASWLFLRSLLDWTNPDPDTVGRARLTSLVEAGCIHIVPARGVRIMRGIAALVVVMSALVGQTTAEDSVKIPANVRSQFEYLVGDWVSEGEAADGQPATGTLSATWAAGKHMLLFNATWSTPDHKALGSGLFGWDAADKKIHSSEFWDSGTYHHIHHTVKSDTVWEGKEFSGMNRDGQRLRQKVRIEFKPPDKILVKASERVVDGEKEEGGVELTLRRK